MKCYNAVDFKKYFNENMESLGLSTPSGLFDTYSLAVGTASTLVGTLAQLGKGATMGELIGATVGLEKLGVLASVGAAAYTGAVIGSIAVAIGRSSGCGSRIADVFVLASQNNLQFQGFSTFYRRNPEILSAGTAFRQRFAVRAKQFPSNFEYA